MFLSRSPGQEVKWNDGKNLLCLFFPKINKNKIFIFFLNKQSWINLLEKTSEPFIPKSKCV